MTDKPSLAETLLPIIRQWRADHGPGLFVLGICGAQGSGKSTLAAALAEALAGDGLRVATLSLDDLYLTRTARQQLAAEVHPLFATRGVPGTHDIALGLATLDALAQGEAAPLPRFDKGRDDRAPAADWPSPPAECQVLIVEGWCLSAAPQPAEALATPANALEASEDVQAIWRTHANIALAGDYQRFWARLDRLVFLAAPDWEVVAQWREQQEAELRAHAPEAMRPDEVTRFIQHYERLTRWMLEKLPGRANVVVKLGEGREVLDVTPPAPGPAP
jgi:D-glycerate 3-kinase